MHALITLMHLAAAGMTGLLTVAAAYAVLLLLIKVIMALSHRSNMKPKHRYYTMNMGG